MKSAKKTGCISGIERFLEGLSNSNYSPKTIETYTYALNDFAKHLAENGVERFQDLTEDDLIRYGGGLIKKGFKTSTRELYVRAAKLLLKHLEKEGIIFINPAQYLVNPRGERRIQYVPSLKEMERLLEMPDTEKPTGIRDRAFLETLYSSGARLSEILNLKIENIDLNNGVIAVMGKGRKERIVPIGRYAVFWLEEYLKARKFLINNLDCEDLWANRFGEKIKKTGIQKMIASYSKRAGIGKVSAHSIRRACATHMLRNGASPMAIKELLGHADLKTLGQYLQCTITDLKKTHANSEVGQ